MQADAGNLDVQWNALSTVTAEMYPRLSVEVDRGEVSEPWTDQPAGPASARLGVWEAIDRSGPAPGRANRA